MKLLDSIKVQLLSLRFSQQVARAAKVPGATDALIYGDVDETYEQGTPAFEALKDLAAQGFRVEVWEGMLGRVCEAHWDGSVRGKILFFDEDGKSKLMYSATY